MSRLIDADKFFMKVYNASYPVIHGDNDRENGLTMYGIAQLLDEQPTVDAVPVVRCGECRHKYLEHDVWMCRFGLMMPSPDGFCSYGEKVTE